MFWCYVLNSWNTSTKRMLPKICSYPCGLTLSAPFVATFPLSVSLLLFCLVVYMDPTLSSFNRALNCFRFIDLFAPYSSNNLSTKDCATGPFKLRASSCEKTWEPVVLMRAKKHRRGKTVQAFAESIDELYNKKAPSATRRYRCMQVSTWSFVEFWWQVETLVTTSRPQVGCVTGASWSAEHRLFQAPKIFPRLKEAIPFVAQVQHSMKVFASLQMGICYAQPYEGYLYSEKILALRETKMCIFDPLSKTRSTHFYPHFNEEEALWTRLEHPLFLLNGNPRPSPPKSEGIRTHVEYWLKCE